MSVMRCVVVVLVYISGVFGIFGVVVKVSEDFYLGETTKRGATSSFVFVSKVMMMMMMMMDLEWFWWFFFGVFVVLDIFDCILLMYWEMDGEVDEFVVVRV